MSSYYPFFNTDQTPFKVMTDANQFFHIQTTANGWTEIGRRPILEYASLVANITVYVTGIRVSDHNAVSFTQEMGVKRVENGDADIVGTLPSPKMSKDSQMSAADFRVSEDGTDLVVEVKAPNASAMDWCCQISVNHMFGQA